MPVPRAVPLTPTRLPIVPEAHAFGICKRGQKELCCRYFAADKTGYVCLKKAVALRALIDERFAAGTLNAKGDNCSGLTSP